MSAGVRALVLSRIADRLAQQYPGHPLRVGVDGITAAGKSTLAGELTLALIDRGRTTIRLSGDDFHHRSAHRYRQGRDSADGYYEDAYDLEKLALLTLIPLGPGGTRRYHARTHDLTSDALIEDDVRTAPDDAILVLDGSFLQRPELAPHWDEVIYVDTTFEIARIRGASRDAVMFGGTGRAEHAFDARYHAACRRYVAEIAPAERASIVLGNDDLTSPVLHRF